MSANNSGLANHHLYNDLGGAFADLSISESGGDAIRMSHVSLSLGNLGALKAINARNSSGSWPLIRAGAAGLDETSAMTPALGEAIERYSAAVYKEEQFVWATNQELAESALDLDCLPKCSESELRHPMCPLIAPDKLKPIRWVRGLSLFDGSPILIPAVVAYLQLHDMVPQERFWLPISTGCASHISFEQAILSAIFEVVERDAVSLTWLQRLGLPELEIDCVPSVVQPVWERYCEGSRDIQFRFFLATSDLGFPTIYGVQLADFSKTACTLVACSTSASIDQAVRKVIEDLAIQRLVFKTPIELPESWDEFAHVLHGGTFMAKAENRPAFEFILSGKRKVKLSDVNAGTPPMDTLKSVIDQLKAKEMPAYVVDLTTDEAIRAGFRVVRVIIPGLLPLSVRYRARFLGHQRLYSAPKSMGFMALSEAELNHWPQPFA